jgi:hypothetical protein
MGNFIYQNWGETTERWYCYAIAKKNEGYKQKTSKAGKP